MDLKTAAYLKQMLISTYKCKKPFELLVIDKKPKTRIEVYVVDKHRISVAQIKGLFTDSQIGDIIESSQSSQE